MHKNSKNNAKANPSTPEFENMVENFFSDPDTIPASEKSRERIRVRNGNRKENLHMQNLIKNKAAVELVVKSETKSYHKLNAKNYTDDGKIKSDAKKENNRDIRRTTGKIAKGSAYKRGTESVSLENPFDALNEFESEGANNDASSDK